MNIAHLMPTRLMIQSIFGVDLDAEQIEYTKKTGKKFENLREIIMDIVEHEEIELDQNYLYVGFGGHGIEISTNFYEDVEVDWEEEEAGEGWDPEEPVGDVFIHFDQYGTYKSMEKDYA